MSESRDLLARAETTPLARDPIAALAEAAPAEGLIEALERALHEGRSRAATVLAFAAGVAGAKVPAPLVIRLAPDLEDMDLLPQILALVEGDRVAALLDLVATDRLSWEREATVLYFAARLLDGAEPPARLTARLRSLLREPMSHSAAIAAGMAALLLNDPDVNAVAGNTITLGLYATAKGLDGLLWELFSRPLLDSLPEQELPPARSGFTVLRTEPKVGRNDPCPCGSGRKYKKCCAGKETAPPVRRSLVEQFQEIGPRAPRVRQQLFETMRPAELERLDPAELTALQGIQALRKLALHHRWEAAERFMENLATRPNVPHDARPEEHRVELADMALNAGQLELAERQMALADPAPREQMVFDARIALARKSPDALERLEAALRDGHAHDPSLVVDFAAALLRHSPALGILAARGAMSADRLLDAETLLHEIGRARDTLGLPAHEPWEEVLELLLEARSGPGEGEQRDAEIHELQTKLRVAADRARRLGDELSRRERELEAVSGERRQLAAAVEARQDRDDRQRVAELEEERRRLRTKIEGLKGEVAEGAAQRAQLRHELARSADERSRNARAAAPPEPDEPLTDDAEGDAVESRPRRILIPHYATAASRSLAAVPARVAADALQEAARLAGGDAHAWGGAKHMRRAHDVLSVRIGRAWRLLFRLSDDRLEVLDLIHRRDLDNTIARMARG